MSDLLCELHAHTTWSDGLLTMPELVDLYGAEGFDVLCVTDHAALPGTACPGLDYASWRAYLDEVHTEAERARRLYDLLLIPGVELTDNHPDPARAAHALVLGANDFPTVGAGLEITLHGAADAGSALVAAHPHGPSDLGSRAPTRRFWHDRHRLDGLIHRHELFNRDQVFGWVAEARLPAIASGDFHRPEHLCSWKTLVPCAKHERAVLDHLRSRARVYLLPYVPGEPARVAA